MDNDVKPLSFNEFRFVIKDYFKYIFSKTVIIGICVLIFSVLGIAYAFFQKPIYVAEITFAATAESNGGSLGAYAGIAAQLGLNMSTEGGLFEGDNLIELLKSRFLIEKTLLTPVNIEAANTLLVNYYVRVNKINEDWKRTKDTALRNLTFTQNDTHDNRVRDSVMKSICTSILKSMTIEKPDKKLNIISAKVKSGDELFAKLFIETLTNNAIDYYVDYKSKNSKQNVQILEKQTDSVRRMMSGNIEAIAVSNDLNVNPLKQLSRAPIQRKQIDMQANVQMYAELLKQLEFAKIVLRRETPLIQIIDVPILPLEKKKPGRLLTGLLFGFTGGLLMVAFFIMRKFFKD